MINHLKSTIDYPSIRHQRSHTGRTLRHRQGQRDRGTHSDERTKAEAAGASAPTAAAAAVGTASAMNAVLGS